MTIINRHTEVLIIPRINKCGGTPCSIYQLILQKRSTNCLFVFKLRDYALRQDLRHHFHFMVPDEMELGEYNLFLVRASEWEERELNDVFIKDTFRQTAKGAIMINGSYMVSNGCVMVTKNKKSELKELGTCRCGCSIRYLVNDNSDDPRVSGELFEELEIIYSGLLKLVPDELATTDHFVERANTNSNKFVEYGG